MGVDARLYVSSKWKLDDIKTVIESYLRFKVKIESNHKISPGFFYFHLMRDKKEKRTIAVFMNCNTALGTVTYLSLRSDNEAIGILKKIAEVLGGHLNKQDFDDMFDEIPGMFDKDDGLPYFYKYAVLHNEMLNDNDLKGLNESIKKWQKKYKSKTVLTFND
jgi:hypothetical protein